MAGILDALQNPDGFDPQSQGILKAAFALMAAGAPTRMPTGMGEALGQAGTAGVDAYEKAKANQVAEAQRKLQVAKLASEVKMQQALEEGGGALNGSDPDKLEAVGVRLAAAGHPGGAGIINAAEKIRAKKQAADRLASLQSGVAPDPQEAEQAADQGTPAPSQKGLFAPYFSSPFVGEQAKATQSQLDREKNANPDDYLKRLDALATAHRAAQEKENARLQRQADLPKSEHVIRDTMSPTGWSYEDTRSGTVTKGAPPPASAAAQSVNDVVPAHQKDMHGDDYLATLPTGMAQMVKAAAEGKLDPSKAASMRYGNREAFNQRILQYDPTYTQNRTKVYQDFTTGKAAQNATAMNTVVAHMGTVADLVDAQKNGNVQTVNALLNRTRTEFGDPSINNSEIAIQAMGNELMRVFRQVNASQHEVEAWERKFNAAKGSPEQMKGALKVGGELLKGRLEAMQDQWDRGMGNAERKSAGLSTIDFPLLSDKSKQALSRLGVVGKDIPLTSQSEAPAAPRRKWNPATGKVE